MADYGQNGPVHQVTFDPASGKNNVYFGPPGMKPGHAVVDTQGNLEYLRGAGAQVAPSVDTGRFIK